jgi:hypothetical protein
VGVGVGLGDGVGTALRHAASPATTRMIASADARIDRPITTPQIRSVGSVDIITHRSLVDAEDRRNVSVERLPGAESLCYSPAGDRPVLLCPG